VASFRVLGPVEAWTDERQLVLGGPQQVKLLAFLLLHTNRAVSADRLIDAVWGSERDGALKRLQMGVLRLRRALAPLDQQNGPRLRTVSGGYLLAVDPGELDAEVFAARVRDGRRALADGDPARASESLAAALGLWRSAPLAEVAFEDFAQAEIRRLEELRLVAFETRLDADLQCGRHNELIPELEGLLAEHPARERLAGQLMIALYRSGRQADALEVYQRTRTHLAEELGLEPGPALKALQEQVYGQSSELLRDELRLEPSSEVRKMERSVRNQDATVESPARGAPAPPANLPVPATAFVGRRHEVAELAGLLESGGTRLLTLTGAGGSGKTRLALRVAETCAEQYRDGTWFVGFADITDPELIAPAICQTLGLADEAALAPVRRLEQWLGERQVLLVLDNLEQLAGGSAVLAEVLSACPGATLLVTSREPLHLAGEQQYEVPVLEPEDAVALFDSRTQAVVPGLVVHPKLADAICARLDYLPLAIELAAARTKALAPGDILRRLDTRLSLLTGGPRDAPRRQQTLRATLDWSYELLDAEQQQLFARLAVFAGGCTFDAAEAVCGAELDTLEALVDRSLVRTNGERYWMLPTLREYGVERLEQTGQAEDLRRSHARWFVGFIHSEGLDAHIPWTPALLGRVRAERENCRGALEWAALSGDHEAVARLAWPLTFYWWESQGQLQEAGRWVGIALEHLAEYPPRLRVGVLEAATHLAAWRGEQKQALAFSKQTRAILPQVDDPNIVSDVTMSDGLLASQRGDLDYARAAIEDAVRVAREHNYRQNLSAGLVNLGDIAIEQGRLDEGRALLEEAIACSDPTLPPDAVALMNLSEIAALQGRYRDAASIGRTALATALDNGDQLRAVWATFHIAWALAELGELERSGRLIGAATAFLQNGGFARSRSDLLCEKGVLDALHRRLAADAVHTLVQQGGDAPLEEALGDALTESPKLSATPAARPEST
jgi:predicted ATPase/DNA-binding SARP family transcriptional activator